jgi:hypothetical protein
VARGAGEEGLNHQVVSFKSPADTPAMPGMPRKSAAFVPRYQKFESISLQQTVRLSRDVSFLYGKTRQLPRGGRAQPSGWAGRDAQSSSRSRQLPIISLSGLISVPQCRRRGLETVATPVHSKRVGS